MRTLTFPTPPRPSSTESCGSRNPAGADRIVWGTMLAAAASLALILTLNLRDSKCGFDGIEIAEGIQQIMNLDTDNVRSVTATPEGNRVILTALMKDGSECSYVMRREDGASAVSITAMK